MHKLDSIGPVELQANHRAIPVKEVIGYVDRRTTMRYVHGTDEASVAVEAPARRGKEEDATNLPRALDTSTWTQAYVKVERNGGVAQVVRAWDS